MKPSARLRIATTALAILATLSAAHAQSQSQPATAASEQPVAVASVPDIPNLPPKPPAPEPFANAEINAYLIDYDATTDAYIAAVYARRKYRDTEVSKVVPLLDAIVSRAPRIRALLEGTEDAAARSRFEDYIRLQGERINATMKHYLAKK